MILDAAGHQAPGAGPVLVLAALVAHRYGDARSLVLHADGGGNLVDVLSARSAGSRDVLDDVLVPVDIDFGLFNFGQHGDGRGRRVYAALGLSLRYALNP